MIEELHDEMAAQPYMYEEILDNLIKPKDKPSPEKFLSERRYAGIFDEERKRRYWVDGKCNNCFMLYARALTITLGEDSRYWRWYPVTASRHSSVVVAELLDVCSLEVKGDFDTKYLTPGTEYEVSFVFMLKDPTYGWEENVDFSLTLPQTSDQPQIRKLDMRKVPKGRWRYFRAAEFTPSQGQSSIMNFKLRQTAEKWKKGLVIMGVYIRPKI